MRKTILTLLSTLLIGYSLCSIPANAEWRQDSTGWWYADGSSWVTGWKQIDGYWYYFKNDGYMVSSSCSFYNSIGSYSVSWPIECDGKSYYFDENGHMLHDCFVVSGSGMFQSWLNSNGELTHEFYGNKYSGNYDLTYADLTHVPSLNGHTETEAKELANKIGLKLNIKYENIPDSNLNNKVLAQSNVDSKIIKNETESTIIVGKYSDSYSNLSNKQIETFMMDLGKKYDNSFSWLHFLGLYPDDISIEISESTKFSKDEIENAIQNVRSNFSFPGATLTKIWYDEENSNHLVDGYLKYGRGSINGVKAENVIILLSNFDVDGSGINPVLEPNTTYSDYQWILIRDDKNNVWKIDDSGY